MIDVTPRSCHDLYEIYPGRRSENDEDPAVLWRRYALLLENAGYTIPTDRGDGKRNMASCEL